MWFSEHIHQHLDGDSFSVIRDTINLALLSKLHGGMFGTRQFNGAEKVCLFDRRLHGAVLRKRLA